MLSSLPLAQQAAIGDCPSFDPFTFDQNGLSSPEVNIGGRKVADALMISHVIIIGDEGLDLFSAMSQKFGGPRARKSKKGLGERGS